MAFLQNFQASQNFRLEQLKKDVIHVLRKHPQGVRKSDIWSLVLRETGREVSAKSYGVHKMSRVLEKWSDEITTTGWPNECLFLKEKNGNEIKEPVQATQPVAVGLMAEIERRAQKADISLPSSSSADVSKNYLSDVNNIDEEDGKKNQKCYQVDNVSDCEFVDNINIDPEPVTNDYDHLIQRLPDIRSWILEYLTVPSRNGSCKFSRLRTFLKHKLKDTYNDNSFKERTLKMLLTEQFQDLVSMEQTEKSLHVYLQDAVKADQTCTSSTVSERPTAMSLMTQFSQSGNPALQKGRSFEKNQNTAKSSTLGYISLSINDDPNKTANVIDLTEDKELSKPTPSLGSVPFGAPACTSRINKPTHQVSLMSKFGAFPVPSNLLKPLHKEAQPFNLGAPATTEKLTHIDTPDVSYSFPNRRDPSLPGFREQVIDLTIEPVNKTRFVRKPIDVRQVYVPRGTLPSREHVDTVAKECVAMLADADENVSMERVEKLVCQRFDCYNLRQLGIQYTDQLPCVNELNRLLCKINLYIIVFVKTRSICTVYELKEALKDYAPGRAGFDSLKLGPLQRFPVVFQQFRFPTDQVEIPKITSMDILDHFHNYLTKRNLWNKKLELEPFMNYLMEEYQADNTFQLGVRIRSLPLAAAVLKKAQRDSGNHHRQIVQHFKEELKNEIGDAFRKFRACILQTGAGEGMEVRAHYMKMRPDLAILEIFDKFNVLLMVTQVGDRTTTRVAKIRKLFEDFLTAVKGDDLCKNILHLAICMTNTAVEEAAMKILTPEIVIDSDDETEQKTTVSKPPPRKDALIESLKTYIERCLNAGAVSLTHLDRIEEKMLDDFGYKAFSMMGYGRFLEFLLVEMKQLLEEGAGLMLGLGSGGHDTESAFKPHQADILEFIKQCRQCGLTQPEQIEEALCRQYSVKEVRHLGYGNIARLLSYADKHSRHTYRELTVLYESTLVKPSGFQSSTSSKVGILGHQTKDAAKICLHSCPLLENLADWSQWNLVFEPELGKLKDFVHKYGGVTTKTLEGGKLATLDFLALESKPGEYIKIVSTTSPEHVVTALENRDARSAAGHLVSMAVAYRGVESMPLALLSGHVKTALLMMHAEEATPDSPGQSAGTSDQHRAVMFVLQSLLHIPTKVCVSLANQIFLEPLGQVVGSSKSKQLLVQLCKTDAELNQLIQLIQLGCLLGIPEWTHMIQQKCQLPDSAIQIIPPDAEELFGEVNPEQEEEEDIEMFEEDGTEDVDEILAGGLVKDLESGEEKSKKSKSEKDNVETEDTGKKDVKTENTDEEKEMNMEEGEKIAETEVSGEYEDESKAEVGSEDMPEKKLPTTEDIVNQIRRDEFGVGVHLSEDGQRLMKVQQERLGRSLDRLSKDLYSKDTHFVLELVQNADDNSYPDNLYDNTSECPSVKFVIENDGIYVFNNELGFREKDIRALCDVGRSTKGKHKFGYIGQKGIGFKSVFRITDAPEVHSNGYHIKFDVKSGPMGYILPHWILEPDRISQDGWMTHIILRLKPEMRVQAQTLAARFNDIHPSLLLFLHRLRQITIENKVEKSMQTMTRRDVGDSVVEIQHTHGCDRWLIIKKVLDAKKILLQTKSGADVESTEVALAFPLRQQGQKIVQTMPPKQPVFAFLPLRSYGFRFIVQGDFDVPSSREDVDRDSSWNQWLRNEIHNAFVDALEVFKTHPEFNSMEAVCTFLQFVPMEDEVLDFFKPVASDILKKLKAKPCVPTQPNSEGVMSWKIPSQTVRVRDPLVRSVITPDLLQKHLNLFYLHTDVAAMLNPTLTSCLGIETINSDHLFQLGKALIVNMGTHCTEQEDIELIARWMACLYRSLDEFHQEDTILTMLKAQRMLPLSDGQLVSMQDRTVFYPLDDSSSKKRKNHKDTIYYIQQDANTLHPLLLNTEDDEVNSQVHKLLMRLGVKELSPFDVINHHIIPAMKSDTWKTKSDETLIAYMVYIKEQTEKQNSVCNLEEVKDIAMVKTNLGFKYPSKEPVHFPPTYGNEINLQETFFGYDWTLLDESYLPKDCSQVTIQSWVDFLKKLGVEEFVSVRRKDVHLKREDLAKSQWSAFSAQWPDELEFVVHDFYSAELEGLMLNNKTPAGDEYAEQMKNLYFCLDKHWESFSKYCMTHVHDKDGNVLQEAETSFGILLKTSPWLPAIRTETSQKFDGSIAREFKTVMKEPSCLYIDTETVQKLLSDKVLYLNVKPSGKDFYKFLGLQNSVTIETVKEYVLKWGERTAEGTPTVFCTSLEHMKNVYLYLDKELKRKEFQDLLRENPVFFVPDKCASYMYDRSEVVPGKMLNRSEVWLSDKTGLFEKHQQILEAYHSEICGKRTIEGFYSDKSDIVELFKQEGRLDTQPKVEEYIELLCALCSTYTPKDAKIRSDVLYIYSTIGQALSTLSDSMPDEQTTNVALEALVSTVKLTLQKKKVFPTSKQVWVSLDDVPLINDNKDFVKMFRDKPGVHFIDMEDQASKIFKVKRTKSKSRKQRALNVLERRIQPDMIDEVIEVCGIKKLSEVVNVVPTPDMIEPCTDLQLYFSRIIPYLQKYLTARYPDVYHDLEHLNTKQMLKNARFFQAGKLEVSYWLTTMTKDTFVVQQEKCNISPPEFYFHKEYLTAMSEINKEIVKYFSCGNSDCLTSLRSFLSELAYSVAGVTDETVDEVLLRYEAGGVEVADEEKWTVEPPMIAIPLDRQSIPAPEPTQTEVEPEGQIQKPLELPIWPSDIRSKKKEKKEGSTTWPPIETKEYLKSVKSLPENIRMIRKGEQEVEGEIVDNTEPGTSGESRLKNADEQLEACSEKTEIRKRKMSHANEEVSPKKLREEYSNEPDREKGVLPASSDDDDERPRRSFRGVDHHRFKGDDDDDYESRHEARYRSSDDEDDRERISRRRPYDDDDSNYRRRRQIKGDPVWRQMATEYTFDELGTGGDLAAAKNLTLEEGAADPEIGRWGERLVAQYLDRQKELGNIDGYMWRNDDEEVGEPFDFEVMVKDESGLHKDYIEVKSTRSNSKEVFQISVQQIKFADEKKNRFHIYRVFNAGDSEQVRLIRITDLDTRLSTKQVKLCMLI